MGVMFSEEIDKLRVAAHDAAERAERERLEKERLQVSLRQERARADQAEEKTRRLELELQNARKQIGDLKERAERVPALETALLDAQAAVNGLRAQAADVGTRLATTIVDRDEQKARRADAEAEARNLRRNLDAARTIVAAARQIVDAHQTISRTISDINMEA